MPLNMKRPISPTFSNLSDLNSNNDPHIASFAPVAPPLSAESSPQSKLEIRTRTNDSISPSKPSFRRPLITSSQSLPSVTQPLPSLNTSKSHTERQCFSPVTSNKRSFTETIDLTIDDEDSQKAEPIQRKKSRSSSIEAGTKRSGTKSAIKSIRLKIGEKSPLSNSSNSESSSQKLTPTIIIPPPQLSPKERRSIFIENLSVLNNVSIVNMIDDTSPPLDFQFVVENVLRDGVEQASDDFMIGCGCRKDNGRNMGCEYLSCSCLDDLINSEGKKQFPYSQAKFNTACLRDAFIKGRNHIYECNKKCNCNKNCKNRVVQHGRTVGLEIFKTTNRGWGLRCTQDLKRGQFIDTYRGEIITHDEANRRGESRTLDQEVYLMWLDKWSEEDGGSKYVCDGMQLGGPTRFINHSCDPNCAIYTVSYNHADANIYDLAFFATEPITAGTELTFNYVDDDNTEIITEEAADELEKQNGYRPAKCLCGSPKCRGYFFT